MLAKKHSIISPFSTESLCEKVCFQIVKSNKLLYLAIVNESLALFEAVLKLIPEEEYDYNMMLRLSLTTNKGDKIILRLIREDACDPNSKCFCIQMPSLLHMAITKSKLTVAEELIRRGADINKPYILSMTPLHVAAKNGNAEAVTLLLHHGADIRLLNDLNETAFECAIWHFAKNVVDVLQQCYTNTNMLVLAAKVTNSLGVELSTEYLRNEDSLDHINDETLQKLMILTMLSETNELFELLWLKIDHMRCFDVLLTCKAMISYLQDEIYPRQYNFRIYIMKFLELNREQRLHFLCKYIKAGSKCSWKVINCLYKKFGFDTELEAILCYGGHPEKTNWDICKDLYLYHLFNAEEPSTSVISYVYNCLFAYSLAFPNNDDKYLAYSSVLRLFALPSETKTDHLKTVATLKDQNNEEKIIFFKKVVTFPSLVELSRTKTRIHIKQYYGVKRPNEFFQIVKQLSLPPLLEDLIMLRIPIYY